MRRPITALLVLLSLSLLAGCGRPGKPQPVVDSPYPRMYPDPSLIPGAPQRTPAGAQAAPQAAPQPSTAPAARPDSSVETLRYYNPVVPGSNLPNTTTIQGGSPYDQSVGPQSQSPLPLPPAFPGEEDQEPPQ
jgi:hypothetical protein